MMEEGVTVINQDELKDFSEDEGNSCYLERSLEDGSLQCFIMAAYHRQS
jgi:hypothetical protein